MSDARRLNMVDALLRLMVELAEVREQGRVSHAQKASIDEDWSLILAELELIAQEIKGLIVAKEALTIDARRNYIRETLIRLVYKLAKARKLGYISHAEKASMDAERAEVQAELELIAQEIEGLIVVKETLTIDARRDTMLEALRGLVHELPEAHKLAPISQVQKAVMDAEWAEVQTELELIAQEIEDLIITD